MRTKNIAHARFNIHLQKNKKAIKLQIFQEDLQKERAGKQGLETHFLSVHTIRISYLMKICNCLRSIFATDCKKPWL